MLKRYHNDNDERFKNVIDSLKSLPRETAPDDFEASLRRRLNLIEAAGASERKRYKTRRNYLTPFPILRLLYPLAGVAAAVIIYMMVPFSTGTDNQNPLMVTPEKRGQTQSNMADGENYLIRPEEVTPNDVVVKKETPRQTIARTETGKPSGTGSRDVASARSLKSRITQYGLPGEEHDVDRGLSARPDPNGGQSGYSQGSQSVGFDGFAIQQSSSQSIQELRKRVDSIRRMMHDNNIPGNNIRVRENNLQQERPQENNRR